MLCRVFRRRFPDCRIDYLVKAGFAPLLRPNPHISRVIEFPDHAGAGDLLAFRRRVGSERYDLIIDIHNNIRSRAMTAGVAPTVRVNKRLFARFILVKTGRDLYDRFGGSPSVAERYLETVERFGVTNDGKGTEIFAPDGSAGRIDMLLATAGVIPGTRLVGLCPSARHATKMWVKEGFASVAATLARDNGCGILLFGAREEFPRCEEIASLIRGDAPGATVVNLAGRISLDDYGTAMDRCAVIICNDTGLMHIAAARKRPVVALFGSTVRQFGFFPYGTAGTVLENAGLGCRPCTHVGRDVCPQGHFRCMKEIGVADVLGAAQQYLRPTSAHG